MKLISPYSTYFLDMRKVNKKGMKKMEANDYQVKAHEFATYGANSMYPALGLAEEAGEVCGKVAKFIRKHDGRTPRTGTLPPNAPRDDGMWGDEFEFRANLSKELGDVCWMVAELCTMYGLDMYSVMEENIAKLTDRKARGVIVGSGDNR